MIGIDDQTDVETNGLEIQCVEGVGAFLFFALNSLIATKCTHAPLKHAPAIHVPYVLALTLNAHPLPHLISSHLCACVASETIQSGRSTSRPSPHGCPTLRRARRM